MGTSTYADEAQTHIERALRLRRPEHMRSFGLDQAGLARTHFVQRELEQAVIVGNRAIDVAEQTQSDRLRVRLQDVYRLTVPYKRVPAVREFADRLASSLSN